MIVFEWRLSPLWELSEAFAGIPTNNATRNVEYSAVFIGFVPRWCTDVGTAVHCSSFRFVGSPSPRSNTAYRLRASTYPAGVPDEHNKASNPDSLTLVQIAGRHHESSALHRIVKPLKYRSLPSIYISSHVRLAQPMGAPPQDAL
jgi:hypothetical protein